MAAAERSPAAERAVAEHAGAWLARLPRACAASAARLRRLPEIEAAAADEVLWLRGPELRAVATELTKVPGLERFVLAGARWLIPIGATVATARVPAGLDWVPLRAWLRPALPPAAMVGGPVPRVPVTVVRAAEERAAGALLVAAAAFEWWCEHAAEVRLRSLVFAAARDGRVLVVGRPLPPLLGTPCTEAAGLIVPCGFRWWPPVDAPSLRAVLRLQPGDLALLTEHGCERIEATAAVAVSRSAVRLTARRRACAGER